MHIWTEDVLLLYRDTKALAPGSCSYFVLTSSARQAIKHALALMLIPNCEAYGIDIASKRRMQCLVSRSKIGTG